MTPARDFTAMNLARARERYRAARLGLLLAVAAFLAVLPGALTLAGYALAADPESSTMPKAKKSAVSAPPESPKPPAGKTAPEEPRGGGVEDSQAAAPPPLPDVGARVWVVDTMSAHCWRRGYVERHEDGEAVLRFDGEAAPHPYSFKPGAVQVLP